MTIEKYKEKLWFLALAGYTNEDNDGYLRKCKTHFPGGRLITTGRTAITSLLEELTNDDIESSDIGILHLVEDTYDITKEQFNIFESHLKENALILFENVFGYDGWEEGPIKFMFENRFKFQPVFIKGQYQHHAGIGCLYCDEETARGRELYEKELEEFDIWEANHGIIGKSCIENACVELYKVLDVPGDIVELGCHGGDSSKHFAKIVRTYAKDKQLWLYDSFEGFPEQEGPYATGNPGDLKIGKEFIERNFDIHRLPKPNIFQTWFKDIKPHMMPEKISFGFLDGDIYSAILESLQLCWPRLSPGGTLVIHDYDNASYTGVKIAIEEFFKDDMPSIIVKGVNAIIKKS